MQNTAEDRTTSGASALEGRSSATGTDRSEPLSARLQEQAGRMREGRRGGCHTAPPAVESRQVGVGPAMALDQGAGGGHGGIERLQGATKSTAVTPFSGADSTHDGHSGDGVGDSDSAAAMDGTTRVDGDWFVAGKRIGDGGSTACVGPAVGVGAAGVGGSSSGGARDGGDEVRVVLVCGSDLLLSFATPGVWLPEQVREGCGEVQACEWHTATASAKVIISTTNGFSEERCS